MPIYHRHFHARLAAATTSAEIDEAQVLATSLKLCQNWHVGLDLIHAGIPLAPLAEARVTLDLAGAYGAVRLLEHVRSARSQLLGAGRQRETWMMAAPHDLLSFLFAALVQRDGGHFFDVHRSSFRGAVGPHQLETPLDTGTPLSEAVPANAPGGVLVIASAERYLNPLVPLIAPLREEADGAVLVPRSGREWPILHRLPGEIPVLFVEDLYTPPVADVFADWQARGRHLWNENQRLLWERFQVDGMSLWELVAAGMEVILTRYLPHCAAYVEMAQQLFAVSQPGVVITAKLTRPVENAFFAVAAQQGTQRMQVMHGHITPFPEHFFAQGRFAESDRVCLWGDYYLRVLARHLGEDLERKAVVTGNPAWDALVREVGALPPKARLREQAAQALRLPVEGFWVAYLSDAISTRQYPAAQAAVANTPGALLLVKVHPAETIELYQRHVIPPMAGRVAVVQTHPELDLQRLLKASDLAITYSSTTALESILAGTPVVCAALDPEMVHRYPTVDWRQYGIPVATAFPELVQTVHSLATDASERARLLETQRAGLRPLVRNSDGSSAVDAVLAQIRACLEAFRHAKRHLADSSVGAR